jgi:hypothetical protein
MWFKTKIIKEHDFRGVTLLAFFIHMGVKEED